MILISLSYAVRRLSNGAFGLLIFPSDKSLETARELTAETEAYPAAIWAVSLLLPGGVRLSLPASALPEAVDRVGKEGAAALLKFKEQPRWLPVAAEEADEGIRRLIKSLGGETVNENRTVLLRWDASPENVSELLRDHGPDAVLAVDPRGRLEGPSLPRPLPLNWADESQLRLRFAMRETDEEDSAVRFFLPPGRVVLVDGERLSAGEYTLRAGGLARMLPAAARAAAAGASACMDAHWPTISEVWDLYALWLGSGFSQPPDGEGPPVWGAVRGLLPEAWERRMPPMKPLNGRDAEYLSQYLLASRIPSGSPDRPLGRHGARELVRSLCGLDTGSPRRPEEVLALLRLGASRTYFSEAPRVLYWDRPQIEDLVARLEAAF